MTLIPYMNDLQKFGPKFASFFRFASVYLFPVFVKRFGRRLSRMGIS